MNPRSYFGILDRYFIREAAIVWVAVTLVLFVIMMGSGFARFLGRAAAGKLPQELVLQLVGLSSLEYLVIIIPISILLAIMLALGRYYRDNEMAAMGAAGIGLVRLYRPYIWLIMVVAALTAWLSLELSPWANGQVRHLRDKGKAQAVDFNAFTPGKFHVVMDGLGVFYTEGIDSKTGDFKKVFLRAEAKNNTIVILANRAEPGIDPSTKESLMILRDGYRYEGQPGQRNYKITSFREHGVRIEPRPLGLRDEVGTKSLNELLQSVEHRDFVELNWRLSIPITVILLGLLAVPLSHTQPRQGRYAQLVVALLIYMLYSNLLTAGRIWTDDSKGSPLLGIWSIHLALFVVIVWIIGKREGWWARMGKTG